MLGLTIDWTVSIGNILTIGALLATIVSVFYNMKFDIGVLRVGMKHLEDRQSLLNDAFTQLSKILTQVAVQDTRIAMLEKTMDDLKRGKGFVKD